MHCNLRKAPGRVAGLAVAAAMAAGLAPAADWPPPEEAWLPSPDGHVWPGEEATIEFVDASPKSFSTCSSRVPGYAFAQYWVVPGALTPGVCSHNGRSSTPS